MEFSKDQSNLMRTRNIPSWAGMRAPGGGGGMDKMRAWIFGDVYRVNSGLWHNMRKTSTLQQKHT